MQLNAGDKAPGFILHNTDKKEVKLSDYHGKPIVLLFFPLAFTSVCTAELCSIRDEKSEYDTLDATVMAISVDSVFSLEEFKKQQGFTFDLLSDFNKEVSRAYGALYEDFVFDMKGVSKRAAFVIDGSGVVRYAEVLDNAGEIPNFANVKKALQDLN